MQTHYFQPKCRMTFRGLVCCCILWVVPTGAEVRTWRVGDGDHPWILTPVTGRLDWGRGWAVEILTDDDGDGLIDEDGVELVDNDGDGLINEDAVEEQLDNDGDGLFGEDPVDNHDNDGDGLIDEDDVEAFDDDIDGLVDEDGPDPQIDNDGDGLVNEDGLMTNGDDDYDALLNEDPVDGIDNDGDGLVDEDGPRLAERPIQGYYDMAAADPADREPQPGHVAERALPRR